MAVTPSPPRGLASPTSIRRDSGSGSRGGSGWGLQVSSVSCHGHTWGTGAAGRHDARSWGGWGTGEGARHQQLQGVDLLNSTENGKALFGLSL